MDFKSFINFESLITTSLIKAIYIIASILTPIGILLVVPNPGGDFGTLGVMLGLVSKFLMILFALIGIRFYCELIIVIFKIGDNVSKLAKGNDSD